MLMIIGIGSVSLAPIVFAVGISSMLGGAKDKKTSCDDEVKGNQKEKHCGYTIEKALQDVVLMNELKTKQQR